MRELVDIFNDLSELAQTVTANLKQAVPVRCELCGKWGHHTTHKQWICDGCYGRIFFQESRNNAVNSHDAASSESPEEQMKLELN